MQLKTMQLKTVRQSCVSYALIGLAFALSGCDAGSSPPAESAVGQAAPDANDDSFGSSNAQPLELPGAKQHEFQGYTFKLPERFETVETARPANMPESMHVGAWRVQTNPETLEALLVVTTHSDPKLMEEAQQGLTQAMVNQSAGTANGMGIKLTGRSEPKTLAADGISLTSFDFAGTDAANQPIGGSIYGFIDATKTVFIMHVEYSNDPQSAITEISKHLKSLKAM